MCLYRNPEKVLVVCCIFILTVGCSRKNTEVATPKTPNKNTIHQVSVDDVNTLDVAQKNPDKLSVDLLEGGQQKAKTEKKNKVSAILPITHYCLSRIKIHVNAIKENNINAICDKLEKLEESFHGDMATQYQPVDEDTNDTIEMYIFDNYQHYIKNVKDISGLSFNPRGGFFYEGDPFDSTTSSTIYLFVSSSKDFSIWNIEHEYTHHLNARYVKYGFVNDGKRFLFWEEGLAEYFAKGVASQSAVALLKSGERLSLAKIFDITYSASNNGVYIWSYLAMWYLIHEQENDLFLLVNALRSDNLDVYEVLLKTIEITHEDDFQKWLNQI